MMDSISFVIAILSTYRLAVIVTQDEITRPLRERVMQIDGRTGYWLNYLLNCTFCASVWCGWLVVTMLILGGLPGLMFTGGLATSAAAILIGQLMSRIMNPGGMQHDHFLRQGDG